MSTLSNCATAEPSLAVEFDALIWTVRDDPIDWDTVYKRYFASLRASFGPTSRG